MVPSITIDDNPGLSLEKEVLEDCTMPITVSGTAAAQLCGKM
jgi:hypothetical protein